MRGLTLGLAVVCLVVAVVVVDANKKGKNPGNRQSKPTRSEPERSRQEPQTQQAEKIVQAEEEAEQQQQQNKPAVKDNSSAGQKETPKDEQPNQEEDKKKEQKPKQDGNKEEGEQPKEEGSKKEDGQPRQGGNTEEGEQPKKDDQPKQEGDMKKEEHPKQDGNKEEGEQQKQEGSKKEDGQPREGGNTEEEGQQKEEEAVKTEEQTITFNLNDQGLEENKGAQKVTQEPGIFRVGGNPKIFGSFYTKTGTSVIMVTSTVFFSCLSGTSPAVCQGRRRKKDLRSLMAVNNESFNFPSIELDSSADDPQVKAVVKDDLTPKIFGLTVWTTSRVTSTVTIKYTVTDTTIRLSYYCQAGFQELPGFNCAG